MDFQNQDGQSPRIKAIVNLAGQLQTADDEYLAGTIDKDGWIERLKEIDSKLTVAGLRLNARPWVR